MGAFIRRLLSQLLDVKSLVTLMLTICLPMLLLSV